jgi:hypothetical protein
MHSLAPDHSHASAVARPRPCLGVARRVANDHTRFVSPCPACDRRLRIRVAYAGKALQCKHCGHGFVPDGPRARAGSVPSHADLLILVETMLRDRAAPPLPTGLAPAAVA